MKISLGILMVCIAVTAAFAALEDYQYISPKPGSTMNTCESTIIIRPGDFIDASSLARGRINVTGSSSGALSGRFFLSSDRRTMIFHPDRPFAPSESVTVQIAAGIRTVDDRTLPDLAFSFQTTSAPLVANPPRNAEDAITPDGRISIAVMDTLPPGFPKITSQIYDQAAIGEGKLLLSCYGQLGLNFKGDPNDSAYILILNNDGTPYKLKNIGSTKGVGLTDFKMQPDGNYSYPRVLSSYPWTGGGEVIHYVLNQQLAVIDSFQMGNGYVAETHDFRLLPNGHALLMGYYLIPVDMSKYVTGGHPNAYVDGGVVQELDADKNVVFQWRSWDYYDLNRVPWTLVPNNTQQYINVFHLNAISMDRDGQLLLGTPAMGIKVSRQTGEILWMAGGFMNQFSFTNVPGLEGIGDLGGHTFQRLDNGHFLVYDNSPFPWQADANTTSAEVVEYQLDETRLTAERIWKYTPSPIVLGWHAGSAQRLANGNTVIGWGGPASGDRSLIMTEVTAAGKKVMDLYFESGKVESYRVYRMPVNTGEADAKVTVAEIAPNTIYSFVRGDSVDTGIRIKVNSYSGSGYNEITVQRYRYASKKPEFLGKAPLIVPGRVVTSPFAINKLDGDIRFNIDQWGISDPERTLIYYREFTNSGVFLPLTTSYNHVTREVIGAIDNFGEFILGVPDLQSVVLVPKPFYPPDSALVNQALPVTLRWTPAGYVNGYSLQIAREPGFIQPEVDESYVNEALYTLFTMEKNTRYYWRVKAFNDAGESAWSAPFSFRTVPPSITVLVPNGGETWQRGLPHLIKWTTNIPDPIVLELCQQDTVVAPIATVTNNLSFDWEIDPHLATGRYWVKAKSLNADSVFDMSDAFFTIVDTVGTQDDTTVVTKFFLRQNHPNPFIGRTTISWEMPEAAHIRLKIFDLLGREVATLLDTEMPSGIHHVVFDGSRLGSGVFLVKISTPEQTRVRKMIHIN